MEHWFWTNFAPAVGNMMIGMFIYWFTICRREHREK